MAKYISGRVRRTDQDKLTDDRFKYLRLEDAEPNLGDSPDIAGTRRKNSAQTHRRDPRTRAPRTPRRSAGIRLQVS